MHTPTYARTEMPIFRKFQIERKNSRKNETVSLDKNNIKKGGGGGSLKKKKYLNSFIKNQNGQIAINYVR